MAFDDPVPPIAPVGTEPVEPPDVAAVTAAPSARPAPPPTQAGSAVTPAAGELTLGAPVVESELNAPIATPASVTARAAVHDAARHGGRLAQAIEQAGASDASAPPPGTVSDVGDRAQQMGGAMAVASSGQATPRPTPPDVEETTDDHVDPLAPVTRIEAQSRRSDNADREEREANADVHP